MSQGRDEIDSPGARHAECMTALSAEHLRLLPLIADRPVHYLDIPVHGNIGDLLIYRGTLAFFRKNALRVVSMRPCFGPLRRAEPEAVIVMHGGGNFGDLYGHHQAFRKHVIRTHPDHRVIVLPQTIHFQQARAFDDTRRIFERHRDLHLFVRDKSSLASARLLTEQASLMPDMAHQLYPLPRPSRAREGTLHVCRTDAESTGSVCMRLAGASLRFDWPQLVSARTTMTRKTIAGLARAKVPLATPVLMRWWATKSADLVERAIQAFDTFAHVVTDRLHGHILASLLDIPSTVLDNNYGKNHGYVRAWTMQSPLTMLADTGAPAE
jgi:pyruvyl transferase EpsO